MASKTDTEVIIGGRVFTLCGYESEEYLQKVASYINNKLVEYGKVDSFRRQNVDMQNVLLQLNIADDFFKWVTAQRCDYFHAFLAVILLNVIGNGIKKAYHVTSAGILNNYGGFNHIS